jgi:hypothetical protein
MSDAARTQVVVALKQLEESNHVLYIFEKRLLPVARDTDAARAAFTVAGSFVRSSIEKNSWGGLDQRVAEAGTTGGAPARSLGRIPGLGEKEAAR